MNIIKFAKCNWWLIFLVIITITASGYFGHNPKKYNEACQILISLLTAIFSVLSGLKYDSEKIKDQVEKEKQNATAKWMPMAMSCISRLITMQHDIESVKEVSIKALSNIANSNSLDCTKTIANTEIGNRKNSYDRIYEQLNDDIEDWRQFVEANCQGDECSKVNDLIINKRNNHDNPSNKR